MAPHPLDRPVWNSLTTRHAPLSIGDAHARRLDPAIGPFAAAADGTAASVEALASLIPDGDEIWLVEAAPFDLAEDVHLIRRAELDQMVATRVDPPSGRLDIRLLGDADAAEMLALATLTQPGPFRSHTHRLGGFVGIHDGGRLVAMAGERMKVPGYTEVSGVCTHPDHRGRGFAAQLMRAVATRIIARGEAAFLHVYATNSGAIALYEALGFRRRAAIDMQVLVSA